MMNKNNYINAIVGLKISQDFKDRTAKLMKDALNSPQEKNFTTKRIVLSAASIAIVFSISAAAYNLNSNQNEDKLLLSQNESDISTSGNSNAEINSAAQALVIPEIELPNSKTNGASADMMGLFVYKGRVYVQSGTALEMTSDFKVNKEDVLNLRGDYLGKTKGNIDEWSKQEDYATEFASSIGESDVYTVKGYDSRYRLMVYNEYPDGISCAIYDSFGGLTVTSGEDYFDLLKLKGNIISAQWERFDSWNNGKSERTNTSIDSALNKFIDALYSSVPIGEMNDMFSENTNYDSQKFLYLKTKDNLVTSIRLFKNGYVFAAGVGFFKVDQNAFDDFWNTMPVTEPAVSPETTVEIVLPQINSNVTAALNSDSSVFSVGTSSITLKIKNNNDTEIYYGMEYSIEQFTGEKWEASPASDNMMFIEIAQVLQANTEQDFVVDLSQLKPILEAGKYRISKAINGEQFYVEFELKN